MIRSTVRRKKTTGSSSFAALHLAFALGIAATGSAALMAAEPAKVLLFDADKMMDLPLPKAPARAGDGRAGS